MFDGNLYDFWMQSRISEDVFIYVPEHLYQAIIGVRAVSLTGKQKNYIAVLDSTAKQILQHGGDEELLMSLAHKMHQIKDIMDSASKGELDFYCQRFEGFYQYMNLLERMAEASSRGAFNDILKKNGCDDQ
jgi:hypothetical protein